MISTFEFNQEVLGVRTRHNNCNKICILLSSIFTLLFLILILLVVFSTIIIVNEGLLENRTNLIF